MQEPFGDEQFLGQGDARIAVDDINESERANLIEKQTNTRENKVTKFRKEGLAEGPRLRTAMLLMLLSRDEGGRLAY